MDNFHSNLGLSRDYLGITGNDPVSPEISFELTFGFHFLMLYHSLTNLLLFFISINQKYTQTK
jgi:hypothetical protein